jgi:ribosomal protein RSM22 (predicted rRNA methylase)
MPSRFGLLNRVFTELQKLAPEFVPRRTVDFGCGPATAAAALSEVWGESAERYTGVDISQAMLDAAKIMTRDKIRDCTFYSSNSEIMRRAATSGERFDLAVASYALGELPNDPSKRIATQMLFELLDVGGYLVILEPGNPMGSHTARTARQFVLDIFNNVDKSGRTAPEVVSSTFFRTPEGAGKKGKKLFGKLGENDEDEDSEGEEDEDSDFELNDRNSLPNARRGKKTSGKEDRYQQIDMMLAAPKQGGFTYDQLGAHVVAPCTHDRPCPMAAGTWCSFSQKVRFLCMVAIPHVM